MDGFGACTASRRSNVGSEAELGFTGELSALITVLGAFAIALVIVPIILLGVS